VGHGAVVAADGAVCEVGVGSGAGLENRGKKVENARTASALPGVAGS
jgi:hypothetical protein